MENQKPEYTKDARVVMLLAAQIARENGSAEITPEHILLGILRNPDGGAAQTLRILGVSLPTLRSQVEANLPHGDPLPEDAEPVFSSEAQAVLQETFREANARHLPYLDTNLILQGIMLNALLPVSALLRQNGVRLESLRANMRLEKAEGNLPANSTPRGGPANSRGTARVRSRSPNGRAVEISPVFIGITLFTIALAALMFYHLIPAKLGVFLFVIGGWVISLCLHEFGHALTAYRNGDLSVISQGYLSLNPFRYTHWTLSILLPLLFIIAGGIALPGGAVYVNLMAVRSPRKRSLISAAGPVMNLVCLILLAVPLYLGQSINFSVGTSEFWGGISLLAFFQVVALILNLLPIPGLDGFGILAPFLPESVQYTAQSFAQFGYLILFALLWINSPISSGFWTLVSGISSFFGIHSSLVNLGFSLFRFWG